MKIEQIIEIANVHGGKMNNLKTLLKEFEPLRTYFGVKFQPFKYNEIAMKDYKWYNTYKELYFSPREWNEIITIAHESKDVWIDVFDNYSIEIIKINLEFIHGLKFQASILNNFNILNKLSKINLTNLIVILNISSFRLDQIGEIVHRMDDTLSPKEIVLQVGFQNYPTKFLDSGLSKIKVLKERFNNRISFADHIDAKNIESLYLPVVATLLGASIIEKHVKHSTLVTKYDFYSSLTFKEYKKYLQILKRYHDALDQPFINDREVEYLEKTLEKPILNKSLKKAQSINFNEDLYFKRTDQEGLDVYDFKKLVNKFYILSKSKNVGDTLMKEDFKKAIIATIIACRLKSTRLPKKALLKIGDLSSIELCIKNALKFEYVDYTILATSTLEEDSELKNHIFSDNVIFHRGNPDDVIQRYLDIIDKLKIDVVIRVTGDMPYVSNGILKILLRSHFESGADYTSAKKAAIGTNLEIINTNALRKIKSYFPSADYSEYMTYYFTNNPSQFRLNLVDLPEYLVRDYRLTLDYEEDLKMFNLIEEYFKKNNLDYNIELLFDFLYKHPEVANINKHLALRYKTDKKLIETLKRETTIKSKDEK